ncbi:MAG TPA: PAS domain-containing sensor histidine kinase [Gemmatimonadaceae bacterium]|nr:PAS domain-containing sensor histidine kinase [Gemmatimonadaceae bacterium]
MTRSRGRADIPSAAALADELRASEARFREVIERNADAILVVDDDGVVLYANPMAERLFGRDGTELVGTAIGFPIVAGETTELDVVSHGTPRVVEMRVVPSQWSGQDAYIASLRDITERKEAERAAQRLIREQDAREAAEELAHRQRFLLEGSARLSATLDYDETLRTVAELCVTGVADWAVVFCVDDDGRTERVEVQSRDAASATLAGELKAVFAGHGDADAIVKLLVRELGIAAPLVIPMVARGREIGGIVLARTGAHRTFDLGDMALAEDIAARGALALDNAKLFDQVSAANRARSDLLAVVSHDLRTPLTAIVGYADLLALGIPIALPPQSVTHVERIRNSAQHLMYLINELLTFTRLDEGHEVLNVREVDLRDVVHEVATLMEPTAVARGLRLEVSLPADALRLHTDPDKLRQVLLNLAGNAVKYTKSGSVRLSLTAAADGAELQVQDTGVGISAEHLARIYEPFWQVDSSQRSRDGGTGLGLSIVHRMVQLLGGRVQVTSQVGEGTTFTVTVEDRR